MENPRSLSCALISEIDTKNSQLPGGGFSYGKVVLLTDKVED
jgi:hypothetical protein